MRAVRFGEIGNRIRSIGREVERDQRRRGGFGLIRGVEVDRVVAGRGVAVVRPAQFARQVVIVRAEIDRPAFADGVEDERA